MLKPQRIWYRRDAADFPDPSKIWRIFIQLEMDPCVVEMESVIPENATQLRFVEHDQVIENFRTESDPVKRSTWLFCRGDRGERSNLGINP